jgi:hypothetical protein
MTRQPPPTIWQSGRVAPIPETVARPMQSGGCTVVGGDTVRHTPFQITLTTPTLTSIRTHAHARERVQLERTRRPATALPCPSIQDVGRELSSLGPCHAESPRRGSVTLTCSQTQQTSCKSIGTGEHHVSQALCSDHTRTPVRRERDEACVHGLCVCVCVCARAAWGSLIRAKST